MEHLGYLPQIVVLLSAAVFIVAFFQRLNLSPVLGYLVAGAIIGEHGLSYINSNDLKIVAELGIVFLLFAIGLELTLTRLLAMRIHVFGFGTAQLVITAVIIGGACALMGLKMEESLIIGLSLALSSTAIVLRVIADANSQSTQVGRLALANLLLQDLAVVPLLVLVPLLASKASGSSLALIIGGAIGKATVALVVIFLLGRIIIRPLFKSITYKKSSDLFVAATLFVVLGASLATNSMGLSLAMGAFIAGLLVAETQYQNQVEDNIMQFKGLLMGLFFMTVGMTIDPQVIYNKLWLIISASLGLIVLKALIIMGLARLFRFSWPSSIHAGLLLAQGSEFAFILFGLASSQGVGIISPSNAQVLLTIVTITMAVTPLLSKIGEEICKQAESPSLEEGGAVPAEASDLTRHVVIAGFGRTGEMVARLLSAKKVNYVILEADIKRVKKGREEGFPVFHGDASKLQALNSVGIARSKATIITINDNVYLKKTVRVINKSYPDIPIVVRAEDLRSLNVLEKIGATVVVPEKYEAGLQMAGALLKAIGVSEFEVSRLKNQFRAGNYKQAKEIMPIEKSS
ncbi:MAG: kefC [Rickettsiaceae bacterium]|jgi:CPA2 family monovalent cation:H+ antiporter-2|nr:kefC [Rickettsiaceae bacterium]